MAPTNQNLPLDRMRSSIQEAEKPLVQALGANTKALNQVYSKLNELLLVARGGIAPVAPRDPDEEFDDSDEFLDAEREPSQDDVTRAAPRPVTAIDFDMESAIKAAGKWECENATFTDPVDNKTRALRCTDCPIDTNMYCLKEYGLLDTAERALGKTNGDDDDTRNALHRILRGNAPVDAIDPVVQKVPAVLASVKPDVPVERLTRKPAMAIVPRVPQPDPVAVKALAQAKVNADGITAARRAKNGKLIVVAAKKVNTPRTTAALKASIGDRVKAKAKAKPVKKAPAKGKRR